MEKSMYYKLLGGLCCIVLNVYADTPTDTLHSHEDYFENITAVTNTTVLLQCPTVDKTKIQWKLLRDANSPEEQLLKTDSNSYEFGPITAQDKGIYGCFANGSLIKKYNLTVFEPPRFLRRMSKLIIKPAGNMIRLNCKAGGFPQPTIMWYKDDQSPPRRELGEIKITHWSLTVEDSDTNDKGNYTCVVCNVVKCINFTFTVDVVERYHNKPIIISELENKTVSAGANFSMKCQFVSDLHPYILWAKIINETTHVTLKSSGYWEPEVLEMFNVTHEDEGWYACFASNSLGTATSKAYLQVVDEEPDVENVQCLIRAGYDITRLPARSSYFRRPPDYGFERLVSDVSFPKLEVAEMPR